jgi:hypothetical protein
MAGLKDPAVFVWEVIVGPMPLSAKLVGLGNLIEKLKKENPNGWRLVVFTKRRETQTTIQNFLEGHGLKAGIINGDSGERNQETINLFRKKSSWLQGDCIYRSRVRMPGDSGVT